MGMWVFSVGVSVCVSVRGRERKCLRECESVYGCKKERVSKGVRECVFL